MGVLQHLNIPTQAFLTHLDFILSSFVNSASLIYCQPHTVQRFGLCLQ